MTHLNMQIVKQAQMLSFAELFLLFEPGMLLVVPLPQRMKNKPWARAATRIET